MKLIKKLGKWVAYGIGSLCMLLLLILLLLQFSFIQTKIVHFASDWFSKKVGTTARIDKININFFDHVNAEGIYIEDLKGDTLLYAKDLKINMSVVTILKKEIFLEKITLKDAVTNLKQNQDSVFNYQFIVDAFTSEDTTTSESNYLFKIGEVQLENIRAKADILAGKFNADLQNTQLKIENMDLEQMLFHIKEFNINGLNLTAQLAETPPVQTLPEVIDTIVPEVIFPLKDLGMQIIGDQLKIENSNILYQYGTSTKGQYFTTNYVDAKDIEIAIKNIDINEETAKMEILNIAVNLNDTFHLKTLQGKIHFDEKNASINDLVLQTSNSKGRVSAQLEYFNYADLMNFAPATQLDLDVDSLKISLAEISYFVPSLDSISEIQHLKNELLFVDTELNGTVDDIFVQHLDASIGRNQLFTSGRIQNATQTEQLFVKDLNLDIQSHIQEINHFLPKGTLQASANRLGKINLKGHLEGSFAQLNIKNLDLQTQADLKAKLKGNVQNVLNTEQLKYDLKIDQISTSSKDLSAVMPIPEQLKNLDWATISGDVKGDLYQYDVDATLNSNIGDIIADIEVQMNKNYANATYKGWIETNNVDLQKILLNDSLGVLNARIEVDGKGINLQDLNTKMNLFVNDVSFNSYTYQNISIDGFVDSKKFEGTIEANDPNAQIFIQGMADLNDSIPIINIQGQIDTLDLHALHLLSYPLKVQFKLDADLKGYQVDDILGYANIKDILLKNDSTTWQADSIYFLAEVLENEHHQLSLTSPILNASLTGQYDVSNLPDIFSNFADQYFPVSTFIGGSEVNDAVSEQKTEEIRKDYIDVLVEIKDPTRLAQMFQVDLRKLDTASLTFQLDAPNNLSDLKLLVPEVNYGGTVIDNIQLLGDNQANQLKANLSIDKVQLSETMSIPSIIADASMSEKRAKISAKIVEDTSNYRLGFNATIDGSGENMFLNFDEPFYLNFKEWNVDQAAPLPIQPLSNIPKIEFSSNGQSLFVEGDTNLVDIGFQYFDINNLLQLIKYDSTTFKGEINGDLSVGLAGKEAPIEGDLSIKNIAVNQQSVGDIQLKADKRGDIVNAILDLTGGDNLMHAEGKYVMSTDAIDADVNIKNISLQPFEPLLSSVATNISGQIKGQLKVQGTTKAPRVNGDIQLQQISANVNALGTQYTIEKGNIQITEQQIQPNFTFQDSSQNQATLTGKIQHELFQDFKFDLALNAKNFTFLNSIKQADDLFYGKLIANANATIKGDIDLPIIDVTVTTLPQTDVGVQLISNDAILVQESYIVFVDDLDAYTPDQVDSIAQLKYKISSTMDLTIRVNVNEDALVSVVIDPITGDNVQIRGNAQLLVKLPPSGNLDITGVYVVKEGNYSFSYQNLLKKNFEIVPGGRLTFVGDVMSTILDIKARYNTQASTLPLLNNDISTLNDSEKDMVRKRSNVGVVLNAQGRLSQPILKFDIDVSESSSGPVGGSVTQALDRLRLNESDLNKEVFSLLLFNSFTGSSSTGNIATTGTSTALRSVGDLINTQLNRLAGKAEGLELNFNLDQYDDQVSEGGGQITEVNLGVSQSLFNDKVVISVGGNVDVGSGNDEREGLSGVAGDFVLEYKITDDGKYRVKVFQKTDYDVMNDNNLWKTGVGFSYKTKFGRIAKKRKKD